MSQPPGQPPGTHLTLEHIPDAVIDEIMARVRDRLHGEVTGDRVVLTTLAVVREMNIDLRKPEKAGC